MFLQEMVAVLAFIIYRLSEIEAEKEVGQQVLRTMNRKIPQVKF